MTTDIVDTAAGLAPDSPVAALRDVGLASRDIVVLAQIVAFVSYQVRVVAGLRALAEQTRT